MNLDDVGVIEPPRAARLIQETSDKRGIIHKIGVQYFQGDHAIKPFLRCFVNFGRTAEPHALPDFIIT